MTDTVNEVIEKWKKVRDMYSYQSLPKTGMDIVIAEVERLRAELELSKANVETLKKALFEVQNAAIRLGDQVDNAKAELAAAKAASVVPEINWQPMETAPKDGTVILLATTVRVAESSWGVCRPQFDGYVANNGEPCWRASCEQKIRGGFPLYWMPIPPYPSQNNPPPAT